MHYVVDGLLFVVMLWIVLSQEAELCALRRELNDHWMAQGDIWRALHKQKMGMLVRLSKVRGRVHKLEIMGLRHDDMLTGDNDKVLVAEIVNDESSNVAGG